MTHDSLPQARVVRNGSQLIPALPIPRSLDDDEDSIARSIISYAVGFWPLTSVVVLGAIMLVLAANGSAP